MVDTALADLSSVFSQMYSHTGRPSIPPEQLLKAMLLQVLYSIPSNVKLVEQIHFSILFRWFLGLGLDEPVWDHSSFSKNQERLIETDVAVQFMAAILDQAKGEKLVNETHASTTDPEGEIQSDNRQKRFQRARKAANNRQNLCITFRKTSSGGYRDKIRELFKALL